MINAVSAFDHFLTSVENQPKNVIIHRLWIFFAQLDLIDPEYLAIESYIDSLKMKRNPALSALLIAKKLKFEFKEIMRAAYQASIYIAQKPADSF